PELVTRTGAMLELPDVEAKLVHAVRALAAGGYVVTETNEEGEIVFPARLHAAEVRLADRIAALATAPATELVGAEQAIRAFEERSGVTLAAAQSEAVREATKRQLMVITGGPGVGKTTIVRAILAVFDREGLVVRLAAPTGRAAKRLAESTGREASTLHRLLEFDPKRAVFKRDAACAVEADVVVVDEASMIDLPLADALAQAVAVGTRLILVGDVDQLPSVGPGAVLRDLIASRTVPCVRLTHIFRQAEASLIVKNAHLINRGEPPASNPEAKNADFYVIERRDAESAKATILELVTSRIPRRFGLDPVRDVQVLTPMHRGPAGTIALNEALQAALNPAHGIGRDAVVRGTKIFRVGDKVMQLRNDYDRDVWNGDIGIVTRVDREEESLFVRYDEEREIAYEPAALDQLTLSYASSIHKSQGSEYPAVVIPLLTTHFVMLSRNLLYTAVTRGKRLVVLVADPRALSLALAEDRRRERRTRLEPRLIDKIERAREAER
ncbi:MAG: AAA family ATPase, partial [Polyangiaceae bacterium]